MTDLKLVYDQDKAPQRTVLALWEVPDLTACERMLLVYLGTCGFLSGGVGPYSAIAEQTGFSTRSLSRAAHKLKAAGYIQIEKNTGPNGARSANGFWITDKAFQEYADRHPTVDLDAPWPEAGEGL